jgi:hypothetical protein
MEEDFEVWAGKGVIPPPALIVNRFFHDIILEFISYFSRVVRGLVFEVVPP